MPEKRTAGLYWSTVFRRRACRRAGVALAPSWLSPGSPLFTSAGKVEREREKAIPACHSNCPVVCYVISVATSVLLRTTRLFSIYRVFPRGWNISRSIAPSERSSLDEDDGEDLDAVRDISIVSILSRESSTQVRRPDYSESLLSVKIVALIFRGKWIIYKVVSIYLHLRFCMWSSILEETSIILKTTFKNATQFIIF